MPGATTSVTTKKLAWRLILYASSNYFVDEEKETSHGATDKLRQVECQLQTTSGCWLKNSPQTELRPQRQTKLSTSPVEDSADG
ncbi:hypothetical protein J6590_064499 [Homalodisca vitripennis]|nr:hypothetical protein J6590_064499 [Homalodisca vitripennis]